MDKRINRLILSVVITTLIVLASVPLWKYSSERHSAILASNSSDLAISTEVGTFSSLIVVEDDRAFELITPTELSFRNRNSDSKDFKILFLVEKQSTINYQDVKVSLDDNIYNLKELEKIEDDKNYYFVLESSSLKGYSEKKVNARIWLDEDIQNLDDNSYITSNFLAR